MDQQQLREHLDELNTAINASHAPDEDKAKLADLVVEIERQLAAPMLESEPQSLADQVDGMITTFEQDHPAVAGVLNNLMMTLTSMGV